MKYKVGDKVKIREDLLVKHLYAGHLWVTQEMHDLGGKIARITSVDEHQGVYNIDLDNSHAWSAEMFEVVNKDVGKRVVIEIEGDKVVARCGDKEGKVRYRPDKNFYDGAKIALERLKESDRPYAWLKEGVKYYTPAFGAYDEDDDLWLMSIYRGESIDKMNMKRGIAFKTREEAIACAKKMLAAVKQSD